MRHKKTASIIAVLLFCSFFPACGPGPKKLPYTKTEIESQISTQYNAFIDVLEDLKDLLHHDSDLYCARRSKDGYVVNEFNIILSIPRQLEKYSFEATEKEFKEQIFPGLNAPDSDYETLKTRFMEDQQKAETYRSEYQRLLEEYKTNAADLYKGSSTNTLELITVNDEVKDILIAGHLCRPHLSFTSDFENAKLLLTEINKWCRNQPFNYVDGQNTIQYGAHDIYAYPAALSVLNRWENDGWIFLDRDSAMDISKKVVSTRVVPQLSLNYTLVFELDPSLTAAIKTFSEARHKTTVAVVLNGCVINVVPVNEALLNGYLCVYADDFATNFSRLVDVLNAFMDNPIKLPDNF